MASGAADLPIMVTLFVLILLLHVSKHIGFINYRVESNVMASNERYGSAALDAAYI